MDAGALQAQLEKLEAELSTVDSEIAVLYNRKEYLEVKRDELLTSLVQIHEPPPQPIPNEDYSKEHFPWSQQLRELAKRHFNISQFRNLQLPIMNAAKEGQRDVFVIMPTGGGKSLCYQLPALLDSGITLVVSPLVSLIRDQVYHLQEAGVEVGMIIGASSKEDAKRVMDSMTGTAQGKKRAKTEAEDAESPMKLVYVTPEKIAKSKTFLAKLQLVYAAGRLSRIVIDECHCCSQLGHDFRPDYKKLNIFKTIFPKTPIIALTATCPPSVLQNVISILNLTSPNDPRCGTLVFTSPLHRILSNPLNQISSIQTRIFYRLIQFPFFLPTNASYLGPNLIYRVLPKASSAIAVIQEITAWILKHYPEKSGIIYCLSKKDTHNVVEGILKESKGKIKCGVYHADLAEDQKERIHKLWRENRVHVVVATIAFGLGINHPDVRFVIHHSMSKSVEGYYQESGRAGRDGLLAECVLYFRDQDASRLSTLAVGEVEGIRNVYGMLKYAQDISTCRKILFERYFSKEGVSEYMASQSTVNPVSLTQTCGRCDNCTRHTDTKGIVVVEDITIQAFTLCKLLEALGEAEEKVTMLKLIQVWKGLGQKKAPVEALIRSGEAEIPVSKKFKAEELERIINYLILESYLKEDFHFTAYATIAYLMNGSKAKRLLNSRRQNIERGDFGAKVQLGFLQKKGDDLILKAKKAPAKKRVAQDDDDDAGPSARKGKRKAVEPKVSAVRPTEDDDDSGFELLENEYVGFGYDDLIAMGDVGRSADLDVRPPKSSGGGMAGDVISIIDDDDDDDFM